VKWSKVQNLAPFFVFSSTAALLAPPLAVSPYIACANGMILQPLSCIGSGGSGSGVVAVAPSMNPPGSCR